MNILVFTSDKNRHLLPGFCHQFNKHWKNKATRAPNIYIIGHKYPTTPLPMNFSFVSMGDKSPGPELWSNYVRSYVQYFRTNKSNRAIIMLEDYWLTHDVDGDAIYTIYNLVTMLSNALRIDLTADRSTRGHAIIDREGQFNIISSNSGTDYQMSYQAGVWNLDRFLRVTTDGENPWQSEIAGTDRVRELGLKVFGTLENPVKYQPIYRSKKNLYKMDKIPLEDLVELGEKGYIPWVKSIEEYHKR